MGEPASSIHRARTIGILLTAVLLSALIAPQAQAEPVTPPGVVTFADEDRSSELSGEPANQKYQFSSPTSVTYDRDSIGAGASGSRVYVADVGNHLVRVLNLEGAEIGRLDPASVQLAPDSPESAVPTLAAPLGIAFLSAAEADDDRLAGLYVNDIGSHQIHFYRTVAADPGAFLYVTSVGRKGDGGGEDLRLPRNVTVLPQGLIFVSDEFNHRIKGFRLDPATWSATLLTTGGWQDQGGSYVGAGPILPGQDLDYGTDSTRYDDYAQQPEKVEGFRIPQGQAYWRSGGRTFLYVSDNGNNRIKVFEVDESDGSIALADIIGRFLNDGAAEHLKRPRGISADKDGNLFIADTYGGRILRIDNLDTGGGATYRTSKSADVKAVWMYGHLGIQQIEMRTPATALNEDEAMQLPNDAVPVMRADGERYTEDVMSWGSLFEDAPVILVSDTGNHRVKKCWERPDGGALLRCSVSAGVGGESEHEFWGHPRNLPGQLHYASALKHLPAAGSGDGIILASDTPNTVIETYSIDGKYLGPFTDGQLSYGVTGLSVFRGVPGTDDRRVAALVAADATLPWPYTGDSSLRMYEADGVIDELFNLTYRTGGFGVPSISFLNLNTPVAVDVLAEGGGNYGVFVTSAKGYLWRFTYASYSGSLSANWVVGGPDAAKGEDPALDDWNLGSKFFEEGDPGTFDTIQDVTAGGGRVYAVDRRNQRVQVFSATTGQYIGKIGVGGGTYDHPDSINADELFLPHGIDLDTATGSLLIGDGFNFVARKYADPSGLVPGADGRIKPTFDGYWLNPELGTLDGGLFATQHVLRVGDHVFVDSLISNRITRFNAADFTPAS